jgi:hypothetical protein
MQITAAVVREPCAPFAIETPDLTAPRADAGRQRAEGVHPGAGLRMPH